MSLNNLFKMIHNQEETDSPSVLPKIEQFYLKKSHNRDYDVIMEKMTRFHPSSVGYNPVCARKYSIIMNREEFGAKLRLADPHKTSLLRVFDHGHMIHDMYQNDILAKAGCLYGKWKNKDNPSMITEGFYPGERWEYQEPRMKWPEKRMSGYVDGVLFIDGKWYVLEIKSSNSNSFKYIKSVSKFPRDYHIKQAMLYCFAPNDLEECGEIEGAIILYVNKETGEEMDFFIKKDMSIIYPILTDIQTAIEAADAKLLPNRLEDCKTQRSKFAKECVACDFCFRSDV